jgi:hypothetical protein
LRYQLLLTTLNAISPCVAVIAQALAVSSLSIPPWAVLVAVLMVVNIGFSALTRFEVAKLNAQ